MKKLMDSIRRAKAGFAQFRPDGDPGPSVPLEGSRVLLVYLFGALGDAALVLPAAKTLIDGGAKSVTLLVRKSAARILKLTDLPIKLLVIPDELAIPDPSRVDGASSEWAEVEDIALRFEKRVRRKFDVVVDLTLRDSIDSRRWVRASEAEARLGWILSGETAAQAGLTFGTPDDRYQAERHWSRYQMLPLRCLGVSQPSFKFGWNIPDKSQDEAEALFADGRRLVMVPGAASEEKRWDPQHFVRIGRWAAEKHDASIVVTGAPHEGKLVRKIAKEIGASAATYTKKNLATLLALLEQSHVTVTNDTGPMHFSFLLGRPTIAIFTHMSPVCWGPPDRRSEFVVLNAPQNAPIDDATDIWTRTVLHHVDALLGAETS